MLLQKLTKRNNYPAVVEQLNYSQDNEVKEL